MAERMYEPYQFASDSRWEFEILNAGISLGEGPATVTFRLSDPTEIPDFIDAPEGSMLEREFTDDNEQQRDLLLIAHGEAFGRHVDESRGLKLTIRERAWLFRDFNQHYHLQTEVQTDDGNIYFDNCTAEMITGALRRLQGYGECGEELVAGLTESGFFIDSQLKLLNNAALYVFLRDYIWIDYPNIVQKGVAKLEENRQKVHH